MASMKRLVSTVGYRMSFIQRDPRTDKERRSFDGRFNVAEIKHACLLINTADYCQVTALEVRLFFVTLGTRLFNPMRLAGRESQRKNQRRISRKSHFARGTGYVCWVRLRSVVR